MYLVAFRHLSIQNGVARTKIRKIIRLLSKKAIKLCVAWFASRTSPPSIVIPNDKCLKLIKCLAYLTLSLVLLLRASRLLSHISPLIFWHFPALLFGGPALYYSVPAASTPSYSFLTAAPSHLAPFYV